MDTLSLSLFPPLTDTSWEAAYHLVFIFDVVYQVVFNILGTTHPSMASIYGFPMVDPCPTHSAAVVTHPTLWWCTSCQDPCLTLKFLTLYTT